MVPISFVFVLLFLFIAFADGKRPLNSKRQDENNDEVLSSKRQDNNNDEVLNSKRQDNNNEEVLNSKRQDNDNEEVSNNIKSYPPLPTSVGARGIWAYQHGVDDLGTHAMLETAASRTAAINNMNPWSVRRFYGSYGTLQTTDEGSLQVGKWNEELRDNGFSSQLLLGSPRHALPGSNCRGRLAELIQERLIDFHASPLVPHDWFFDTLHLDVEVHAMNENIICDGTEYIEWDLADGPERARRFYMLYLTARQVRDYLDWHGVVDPYGNRMKLEMDLPFWIDSSDDIDWAGSGNPVPFNTPMGWFTSLSSVVDSITLMTYHEDDLTSICTRASQERDWMDPTPVRVGLNPAYDDDLWESKGDVLTAAMGLDTYTSDCGFAVDIFHYKGMMLLP
eukprot:CAMPEP_0194143526 /NCGR_PEP_ID=MMETSP0152-20130528/12689_1 /TAXON_ID=1049557 /ORGANISM="Thalassiothrix antarctica, Strain L6-D1" /LENGTH=392 /DNA_ID=CAMNT_0038842983 /DNA_START=24 /DNA_END=1202 /DNA_ORIENTATION=+